MIYSATIIEAGEVAGTWLVSPAYTRVDGQPAPDIIALAADGITPQPDDIVLCAESINDFEHISALDAWGATGVPPGPTGGIAPFPGTPAAPVWEAATLSENHKLD